jgi:hypothetical protein
VLVSTRTTCRHCGQIILRRSDDVWFSNPSAATDTSYGYRCTSSPDLQHAPASVEQDVPAEVLRLRARVAELESELER